MGAALSVFACAVALLFTMNCVTRSACEPRWWWELPSLGLVITAYFVGWYLAGCVWDALRPIHDRLIGYVLRFGLAGVAIYGTIAAVMPLLDKDPMSLRDTLEFLEFIAGFWALIGVGVWAKDRFWERLAKR
jgi:hypothetical protein